MLLIFFFFFRVVQISVIQKAATAAALSFARCRLFSSQVVPIRGHCSRWPNVCITPHLQLVVSSSPNIFHFLSVILHRPTPVLKRFNAFHFSHFQFLPLGSSSFNSLVVFCSLFFHLLILSFSGGFFIGWIVVRKLFLDLSRGCGGLFPCSGCRGSFCCLCRSISDAISLLISGGVIPDST